MKTKSRVTAALTAAAMTVLFLSPAFGAGQDGLSLAVPAGEYRSLRKYLAAGDVLYADARRAVGSHAVAEAVFVEADYQKSVAVLSGIKDGDWARMLIFSSVADLKSKLASLPRDINYVAYATSVELTPPAEIDDLAESLREFSRVAGRRDLPAEWRPSLGILESNERRLPAFAVNFSRITLPHEPVLVSGGQNAFMKATTRRADLIRGGNPACRVGVHFTASPGYEDETEKAVYRAAPLIDYLSVGPPGGYGSIPEKFIIRVR